MYAEIEGTQQIPTKRDKSDSPSLFSFCWHFAALDHYLHDTVMTPYNSRGPICKARNLLPTIPSGILTTNVSNKPENLLSLKS